MVKVPNKTSSYQKEPVHKNKHTLGFAPELIPFIIKNQKVLTYKFGEKKNNLKKGDLVDIKNSISGELVGKAELISKHKTIFKNLPLNAPGHETYRNKAQQRQVFSGYYAYLGRPIKDDDPFLIFEFKLIK